VSGHCPGVSRCSLTNIGTGTVMINIVELEKKNMTETKGKEHLLDKTWLVLRTKSQHREQSKDEQPTKCWST
jgi:hypothetical protein